MSSSQKAPAHLSLPWRPHPTSVRSIAASSPPPRGPPTSRGSPPPGGPARAWTPRATGREDRHRMGSRWPTGRRRQIGIGLFMPRSTSRILDRPDAERPASANTLQNWVLDGPGAQKASEFGVPSITALTHWTRRDIQKTQSSCGSIRIPIEARTVHPKMFPKTSALGNWRNGRSG